MRRIRYVPSQLLALVLFALVTLGMPSPPFAQFGISITIAPPMLPVYEQPVIPGPGYIWTPGYWAWSPEEGGYFWVPGTWVLAPQAGVLWTPGYWGWAGNAFNWNPGYWGPHIGFYGGVNYGYGYNGSGYQGGYWNRGAFFYNRSVNNITNVRNITNVYNRTVVNNVTINNVSYNGGHGGLNARPTAAQLAATRERHIPPTAEQTQQQRVASTNRALLASVNHGKPPIAATSKPGAFSGRGVVAARAAAPYHPPAQAEQRRAAPAQQRPAAAAEQRPAAAAEQRPAAAAEQRPAAAAEQRRAAPAEQRPAAAAEQRRAVAPAEERRAAPAEQRPAAAAEQRRAAPPHPSGEKPKEE